MNSQRYSDTLWTTKSNNLFYNSIYLISDNDIKVQSFTLKFLKVTGNSITMKTDDADVQRKTVR